MTDRTPDATVEALSRRIPRTGRLIEVGDAFLELMAEKANPGYRVTLAWGEPDAEGVYTPTLTVHNWSQLHSEASARLQEMVWAWEQQEGFEVALKRARAYLAALPEPEAKPGKEET